MQRALGVVVFFLVAGAAIAGCNMGVSATPFEQRANGTILLAATVQPEGMMDAEIAGTLTRTDSGCLALASETESYVLQFPFGTELADDGESVNVPGLGVVHIGDEIAGGGGYIDVPGAPEECRTSREFAVWQQVPD